MKATSSLLFAAAASIGISGSAQAGCRWVFEGIHSRFVCDDDSGGSCLAVFSSSKAFVANHTPNKVNFRVKCGANSYTKFSLDPNVKQSFYCESANSCQNNLPIIIRFDASFVSGVQAKEYSLDDQQTYDFKPSGNGIDLFRR